MIFYQDPNSILYCGHALIELAAMPAESVDMCITSPPYWGLRTYKTEPMIWGDNHCEHEWGDLIPNPMVKSGKHGPASIVAIGTKIAEHAVRKESNQGSFCLKCNAWRGEIGLEPTIELYIEHLILIFNEVKRVLKKTGTCWVNLDDSYAGSGGAHNENHASPGLSKSFARGGAPHYGNLGMANRYLAPKGLSPKSLCLIPQRFAIAMVEQGWILRNDIVWNKPNPMPESVKDRFTGSWEHLFFFVKSKERSNDIKQWLPMPLADDNRAWLAAIIDGEGTIGIRRSKTDRPHDSFGAYVTVSNTNKAIIDKCLMLSSAGKIKKSGAKVNFDVWRWEVCHHNAISIIGEIYPYLIAKREQAKVAIALQKLNKYTGNQYGNTIPSGVYGEKERLWLLSKALNQRLVESSGLKEPNLNRHSGCENYFFEQQFERGLMEAGDSSGADQQDTRITHGIGSSNSGINEAKRKLAVELATVGYTTRNKRDVWEICTVPSPKHKGIRNFATFPEKLCETPILAGCPAQICTKCGRAREPIYNRKPMVIRKTEGYAEASGNRTATAGTMLETASAELEGYTDCGCNAGFEPGVVLDPFAGSGTVGAVAKKLGRKYIGIDLSPDYCKLHVKRLQGISLPMELV